MPTFTFAIKLKKQVHNYKNKKKANYDIVERKAKGVIKIDIEGNYYITFNDKNYPLTEDSYSFKGRLFYYSKKLHNGRFLCHYRSIDLINQELPDCYIPFCPGCCAKGSIIKVNGIEYFKIIKIFNDVYDEETHDARKFYYDNYEKIQCNLGLM